MKILLVVLSAAVVVGLCGYVAFNSCNQFGLIGNNVTMHVNTFVALIACLSAGGAAMALVLRAAVVRADRNQIQALEQRISQLEQNGRSTSRTS